MDPLAVERILVSNGIDDIGGWLCVTDTDAVHEVVFGPQGIAATSQAEALIVDHSTIHPARTHEMASRLRAENKGRWADAPVSGSVDL